MRISDREIRAFAVHLTREERSAAIGTILRKLCEMKDVEIIEAELCPD